MHLASVALRQVDERERERFPFSVPIVRALKTLALDAPVTFFVGENGSGKSTLLEAMAIAAALPVAGSESAERDTTLEAQRRLAKHLKLIWKRRTHRGFFLRAEDFFGFAKSVAIMRAELERRLAELDEEYRERSAYAHGLAAGPMHASLRELERRYGLDLDANSHGQSFLKFFGARFVPDGLFFLDEPEAALSPQSQLALLAMLHDMVASNGQFVIATHSPMLLAFPGARIYDFDRVPPAAVAYEDLEHVALTRDFLNEPRRFLSKLLRDDG